MMARKKRKAVGYVRVSVDDDRKISPDAQRQAIEAYVAQKGWELVDVKIERGRSAGEGKRRPRFEEARAMIGAGHADALVVYKLDRVTRSTIDFADLWRDLSDADCEFVSLTEQFDTTTPMGRAMLQIAVVFAELERAMAADRAKMIHRHRRDNGGAPAGFASYGYRKNDEGKLVVEGRRGRSVAAHAWTGCSRACRCARSCVGTGPRAYPSRCIASSTGRRRWWTGCGGSTRCVGSCPPR